ncbi:hypothetical protein HanIR_Chr11g0512181 [Helianthus annuus]|nr:hypothetical protein HanIR_Chr11g0512181 [Helianthus annuus]
MFVTPPNVRAETPAQGATPKPKPTQSGDVAFVPNPRPIPHSLICLKIVIDC